MLADNPTDVALIASATIMAARTELDRLKGEPSLAYCFWLLTRITWAAKGADFETQLDRLGIGLVGSTSALSFISAVSDHARKKCASYPGSVVFREIANLALKQTLSETVATSAPSLLGSTIQDLRSACRRFSSRKQFGTLARIFFSSFSSRLLQYFTDKELSNHIGPGQLLATIEDGRAFHEALQVYAWQTSKIMEDFAAGWYSKHNWESEGDISETEARKFVAFALKKIQMELNREEAAA